MKKLSLILAMSAFIGAGLVGCSDSEEEVDQEAAASVEQKQEDLKPLGLTIKQFENRFNKFVKDFNAIDADGIKLNRVSFDELKGEEPYQLINSCMTKNTCFLANVEKSTGNVVKMTMMATGDGSAQSGAVAMTFLFLGSAASIPSVEKFNGTAKEVLNLMKSDGKEEFSNVAYSNGYKLSFTRSAMLGNWLHVEKE